MFRRILVANRGEAAFRVLRSCRGLGIETVAVTSTADRAQAWLRQADRVVCVGGPRPCDSYLDQDALLEVARRERCAALHPGWGFLAENAVFAARCEAIGLTFIGPRPHTMARVGDKIRAREAALAAGFCLIPASPGGLVDLADALQVMRRLGPPVLLKAALGGGGRGLRRVSAEEDLAVAWNEVRGEVASAFGASAVYMEKLLTAARHVEFQILADRAGHVMVLGTRDCSVQRRHQKLIEEAPATTVPLREIEAVEAQVVRFARDVGYVGAGTVETLLDARGRLHFLECNARLQVEHPVTEMLWGLDLVEQQLRIAAGEHQPWGHPVPRPGHVIECRLNAEDPERDFEPSPGRLTRFDPPSGVRADTHLIVGPMGEDVPPWYDSLLCKLVVHGSDRISAIDALADALSRTRVEGVPTNRAFLARVLREPSFRADGHDTSLVARLVSSPAPERT